MRRGFLVAASSLGVECRSTTEWWPVQGNHDFPQSGQSTGKSQVSWDRVKDLGKEAIRSAVRIKAVGI